MKNAVGLESLRIWALANYQKDPSFLHPTLPQNPQEAHQGIVESFGFSLLGAPYVFLQDAATEFLKQQVAQFHESKAYIRFRCDYFDVFGLDEESALLLARYQSEKARLAVGVLLSAVYFVVGFLVAVAMLLFSGTGTRFTREQGLLSYFWMALGLFYLILSFVQTCSVLVSAIVCGGIGSYLRTPVVVRYGDDKGLSFRLISLSSRMLAILSWLTFSLVSIQILTWIHTGSLTTPIRLR